MKIKLVLNLDQVGGRSDRTNNTIVCEADNYNKTQGTQSTNDAASLTATNSLKDYVGYYSTLTGVLSYAYGSDYMPFENNGEIITGLYERPTNSSGTVITNPYYHNNTDTIAHLSYPYIFQVTKAALGAMQHFAVASTSTLAVSDIEKTKDFELYPNPAKEILNLHLDDSIKDFSFEISDSNGRVISITKNQKQINTSQLKPGVYFGTLSSEKGKTAKKFIIK